MAIVLADRVKETTSTTGTGTFSLAGAVSGFQTFVSGIGSGNQTYYAAVDGTTAWEVGIGTVTSGSPATLSRDTLLASSTGSAISFAASPTVFCTNPANPTQIKVGANVLINTTAINIGNSTVNTFANSSVVNTGTINLIAGANVGSNVHLTPSTLTIGNSTVNVVVNSSAVAVGANVLINTTAVFLGNATDNTVIFSTYVTSNSTTNTIVEPGFIGIGTGTPTVALTIKTNDGIQFPVGNTFQRPATANGMLRYNSDLSSTEIYNGSGWFPIQHRYATTIIGSQPQVEDSTTNQILQSGDFTTTWTAANTTIAANTTKDPFGATASQLFTPSVSANASVRQTISVANDTSGWAASLYVYNTGSSANSQLRMTFANSTANVLTFNVNFNAQTGLVTSTGGAITGWFSSVYNNGWSRIGMYANNNNSSANSLILEIFPDPSNTQKTLQVFGPQLENQAKSSSYNKTTTGPISRPAGKFNSSTIPVDANTFSSVNGQITITGTVNASTMNATSISFGNSTVNTFINSTVMMISNSTAVSNQTPAQISVGANTQLSTTSLSLGNSTINAVINSSALKIQNSTITTVIHTSGGNTGLGNSTPATRLQVDGNFGVSFVALGVINSTSNNTIDMSKANYFTGTIGGAVTLAYSNIPTSTVYGCIFEFANCGTNITWPANTRWPAATVPSFSGNTDVIVMVTKNGGTDLRTNLSQKDSR